MNTRKLFGGILIAVGILVLSGLVPLTTVVFADEAAILKTVPAGTESDPQIVVPGSGLMISIRVLTYDRASSFTMPGANAVNLWDVSVKIADTTVDLGKSPRVERIGTDTTYYVWEKLWTAPNDPGAIIPFEWKVVVKDSTGKVLNTFEKKTYVRINEGDPDGYFELNGQRADASSTVFINSPNLALKMTPTQASGNIQRAYIEVFRGDAKVATIEMQKQSDGSYSADYSLPDYGIYIVKGYIVSTQNQAFLRLTTVVGTDPNGDGNIDPPINGTQDHGLGETGTWTIPSRLLIGGGLVGIGLIVLFTGRRR